MANHYYAQQLQEKGSMIDLIAEENNNDIQMIISDDLFNTTSAITLTEKEQDDLIAGILERRGMQLVYTKDGLQVWSNLDPITAEGNEQSRIHPHKLPA
jgi:hypothetical protein